MNLIILNKQLFCLTAFTSMLKSQMWRYTWLQTLVLCNSQCSHSDATRHTEWRRSLLPSTAHAFTYCHRLAFYGTSFETFWYIYVLLYLLSTIQGGWIFLTLLNFHFNTLPLTPRYQTYFFYVHPLIWRWMFITTRNNGQNFMLILITGILPGMPHAYKMIHGKNKTFSTKLITVNFKLINFAVNLWTLANYVSKIYVLCRYCDVCKV